MAREGAIYRCRTCGAVRPPQTVTDKQILRGLNHFNVYKKGRASPALIYAAADHSDQKIANVEAWYMTGPRSRLNFADGPFPPQQILRLAKLGKIVAEVLGEDGTVHAYRLADGQAPNAA